MRPLRMSDVMDLIVASNTLSRLSNVMRIQLSSQVMLTPSLPSKINSKESPGRQSTLEIYAFAKTTSITPTRRTTSVGCVTLSPSAILRQRLQGCSGIDSFLCARNADNGSLRRTLRRMGGRDMCLGALVLIISMRNGESCALIVESQPS